MPIEYAPSRRPYKLRGRYRNTVRTGLVTGVAAHTATAGHLFTWRWDDATVTGLLGFVRYVGAKFILTTAYGTDQETGIGMHIARSYTASHTGGNAVDVGGTVTGTGKRYTGQSASLLTSCRIGDTGALTAGTHTLDANPYAVVSDFSTAIGDTVPLASTGGVGGLATLHDSRLTGDHLEFDNDEGFILSNTTAMGATGVGIWAFCVEWDEGVLSGEG